VTSNAEIRLKDYYFWERIKDIVYHERPTMRDNMIRRSEAIRSLRAEESFRAINCFQNRVGACITENGAHFEYLVA